MINIRKYLNGIRLIPQNTIAVDTKGELRYNLTTDKVELYNGAVDPIVTENKAETLTNKTLTSPVLTTPDLGTPSAAVLTNATGLPLTTGTTGVLPETKGGTNQSTYTTGDILYASATNTLSKLPKGTTGQVLTQGASIPAWGTGIALTAPTVQVLTSSSGTYTTPTSPSPLYLVIEMVGAGGGGGGSGATGGIAGVSGGSTTWAVHSGSTFVTAGGGTGGTGSGSGALAPGGNASITSPAISIISLSGGSGGGVFFEQTAGAVQNSASPGGTTVFGGAGQGSYAGAGSQVAAVGGSGAGGASGGGGTGAAIYSGGGGGAGAYTKFQLNSPSSSYDYTIGTGGTGGAGGGGGQAATSGSNGIIYVYEYYQ